LGVLLDDCSSTPLCASSSSLRHKRCVAVSPEGTRSKSGRIQDFKKGAFHTAMQVGVPITPLLVEGAFELWPSSAIFAQPGVVTVTFLQPLKIGPDDSYNTLASKVRRTFFEQLLKSATSQLSEAENGTKAPKGKEFANYGLHTLWLPITYAVLYLIYIAIRLVV
jgi:1-acyl-sn-glycerol-3-phosphate acyltransferase